MMPSSIYRDGHKHFAASSHPQRHDAATPIIHRSVAYLFTTPSCPASDCHRLTTPPQDDGSAGRRTSWPAAHRVMMGYTPRLAARADDERRRPEPRCAILAPPMSPFLIPLSPLTPSMAAQTTAARRRHAAWGADDAGAPRAPALQRMPPFRAAAAAALASRRFGTARHFHPRFSFHASACAAGATIGRL